MFSWITVFFERQFARVLLIVLLPLLLQACASMPRTVTASMGLVSKSPAIGQPISKTVQPFLDSTLKRDFITQGYRVEIGALYQSALGQTCHQLTLVSLKTHQQYQQAACQFVGNEQQSLWYLLPSLQQTTAPILL